MPGIVMCPKCGTRLDRPGSIKAAARGFVTAHLNLIGQLQQDSTVIQKYGTYNCENCGRRLNRTIIQARVGLGGKPDAAATTDGADVSTEGK